jgi:hypothetical protein
MPYNDKNNLSRATHDLFPNATTSIQKWDADEAAGKAAMAAELTRDIKLRNNLDQSWQNARVMIFNKKGNTAVTWEGSMVSQYLYYPRSQSIQSLNPAPRGLRSPSSITTALSNNSG